MHVFDISVAGEKHIRFASTICDLIRQAAGEKDIGLALRTPEYITKKIEEGKAVIAMTGENTVAGFCYLETWDHGRYVANSGLIVAPQFRGQGLARRIKIAAFNLSREKFTDAKLFGLTTSPAVLKINSLIGYRPVGFAELTHDEEFWNGCKTCPNYDILVRTQRKFCLCTGMLYDPAEKKKMKKSGKKNEKTYRIGI